MRRLSGGLKCLPAVIAAFFAVLCFCVAAYAENDVNLLKDYDKLEWNGSPLEYNIGHKTLKLTSENAAEAYIDFPANGASGLWFYADFGNYENSGTGAVGLGFLSENEKISDMRAELSTPDGSFHRYQLGNDGEYFPIPENTDTVRVSLRRGGDGDGPYFRNLSLVLSYSKPLCSEEAREWSVSGKLEPVQVNVSKSQYWIWVGIIAIVPLIFFGVRKARDNARKIK